MTTLSESTVESAALEWLSTLGWQTAHGPDIAPDTPGAEPEHFGQGSRRRSCETHRCRRRFWGR